MNSRLASWLEADSSRRFEARASGLTGVTGVTLCLSDSEVRIEKIVSALEILHATDDFFDEVTGRMIHYFRKDRRRTYGRILAPPGMRGAHQ